MVVQHNLTAMNSNRMLNLTVKSQSKSTEKLSSGYKINRAADDAAGLSISEKMRKQIRGLTQASSNAQDGISCVQTAEGALNEVQDMIQRMNELAVKAANGTLSSDDRGYIQNEIDQLMTEIDRVAATTKFNETYLLNGTYSVDETDGAFYGKLDASIVGTNADLLDNHVLGAYTYAQLQDFISAGFVNSDNAALNSPHNAGFLDLSNINSKSDVESLYGCGISATCTMCDMFCSVKFVDNGDDLGLNADGYKAVSNDASGINLWVDISGCNNGTQIVSKVMDCYAKYNGKAGYEAGTCYSMNKSHHVGIAGYGAKLCLMDTASTSTSYSPQVDGYKGRGGFANGYVGKGAEVTLNNQKLNLHVGADATRNNQIELELGNLSTVALGFKSYKYSWRNESLAPTNLADVTTQDRALRCIDACKEAIQVVSTMRSRFGAIQNRLDHTINNLDNVVENTTAAESQIRDTDMATEMVKYSNNNILAQAGQAMLAQSNQANQGVLSLLG